MTRARTASLGVAELTAIQPLLAAVLMLCVSLVQGATTTLGMIFKRRSRDWHTDDAREDLPQATSGIHLQESNTTHGVAPTRMEADKVRVPREGGGPVLRAAQTHIHGSALTRAVQAPAFAGDTAERIVRKAA